MVTRFFDQQRLQCEHDYTDRYSALSRVDQLDGTEGAAPTITSVEEESRTRALDGLVKALSSGSPIVRIEQDVNLEEHVAESESNAVSTPPFERPESVATTGEKSVGSDNRVRRQRCLIARAEERDRNATSTKTHEPQKTARAWWNGMS